MIAQLIKMFKVLHANDNPAQLAGAFALSMVIGFTPFFSLHNILVILCLCIFRLNIAFFLLGFALFSGIAWALDPVFNQLGAYLLQQDGLRGFWTALYQIDFWRLAHFNNTLTLGSFMVAVMAYLPMYFIALKLIHRYRVVFLEWVKHLPIVKILKASSWFRHAYGMYDVTGGGK